MGGAGTGAFGGRIVFESAGETGVVVETEVGAVTCVFGPEVGAVTCGGDKPGTWAMLPSVGTAGVASLAPVVQSVATGATWLLVEERERDMVVLFFLCLSFLCGKD